MSFDVETLPRQPKKLYRNVKCDGCDIDLKWVGHPSDDPKVWEDYLQADDTLILNLEGGYSMAIDPCGDATEQELKILFCGKCTKKLCEQWPAIAKTVMKHCSSSLGHHCSKERKFVWRTCSDCCNTYCKECGRSGCSQIGIEYDNDIYYSRRIIDCSQGCGYQGSGIWEWEVSSFVWHAQYWDEVKKKCIRIGNLFSTEEEAENCRTKFMLDNPSFKDDEVYVDRMVKL
jgi:hypothetical protein